MSRRLVVAFVFFICFILPSHVLVVGQSAPASDPQALSYAAQSIAALTGASSIIDVTLTGSVAWNAGSDSGTGSLKALGAGESRMDLALSAGVRSEVRDAQTGAPIGQWTNPDKSTGGICTAELLD